MIRCGCMLVMGSVVWFLGWISIVVVVCLVLCVCWCIEVSEGYRCEVSGLLLQLMMDSWCGMLMFVCSVILQILVVILLLLVKMVVGWCLFSSSFLVVVILDLKVQLVLMMWFFGSLILCCNSVLMKLVVCLWVEWQVLGLVISVMLWWLSESRQLVVLVVLLWLWVIIICEFLFSGSVVMWVNWQLILFSMFVSVWFFEVCGIRIMLCSFCCCMK